MADIPRDERQVTDADFFNAMDLSRRGLAKVRRAVEVGDLPAARQATVVYFRTRRRPRWFFDLRDERRGKVPSSWDGYDPRAIVRAEAALENRFHLSGPLVWDFGENLKWRTAEMRGLGAPPSVFKRCLYMRDLAVASAQTRRPAFAAKFAELVGRWLTDWPLTVDRSFGPTKAIMSQSDGHKAMPTAFRVVTWLDCLYGGIVFAPGVPIDTAFGLIRSMWFTAVQYRRFEKCPYMPANHHLWERGRSSPKFS